MPLEGLGMPFCASARLGPAGGVGESLVARLVRGLSPRFIRGLGRLELLSCGKLLLIFISNKYVT